MNTPEEFWAQVDQTGVCWIWKRAVARGYGWLRFRGRPMMAHRVAYLLKNGTLPSDLCVCHHCDNPPCVNPAHLFIGTRADNNRDRDRKGRLGANVGLTMRKYPERRARGERQGSAKLTAAVVRDIRKRAAAGETHRSIARVYGVSKTCVGEIVRRENWAHV